MLGTFQSSGDLRGWLPIIHLSGLVLSVVICCYTWLQGGSCHGNSNQGVYQLPECTGNL